MCAMMVQKFYFLCKSVHLKTNFKDICFSGFLSSSFCVRTIPKFVLIFQAYLTSILNQIDKQVFIWKQILQHGKKHSSIKLLLKNTAIKFLLKITLLPHFMDVIQLFQGYRATTRRQFTYH